MNENITKKIIKDFLKNAGINMKQMVELFNDANPDTPTTPQNFSNKLAKETLRLKEVLQILDACGYELSIHKIGEDPTQINSEPASSNDEYMANLISQKKDIYVHCKDAETAKRFLADCEIDGFLFDDDTKPTGKETADLFRLLPNKKMCYVGAIGHIRWQTDQDDVIKIEY